MYIHEAADDGALYKKAMRLLETLPVYRYGSDNTDARRWVASLMAVGDRVLPLVEQSKLLSYREALGTTAGEGAWQRIQDCLFRTIAILEMRVPPTLSDSFVPVGGAFDAFAALARVFARATREVYVVDPYLDESILTDFAETIPGGVPIRLLADEKAVKASLRPAATRWITQHGTARPLEVRLAPERTLHDRAVFLDGIEAWTVTQSFKDFAARAPGELMKNGNTAALKIDAYNHLWDQSAPV